MSVPQREQHTIGGCPVDLKPAVGATGGSDRAMHGERMRSAALFSIGSDNRHGSDGLADLDQESKPGGKDSIVVGTEDVHRRGR